jgi:hypothetical protein
MDFSAIERLEKIRVRATPYGDPDQDVPGARE